MPFDGIIWLVATSVPFILVQRWVQRQIQTVFLLITHSPTATIVIFSLLFLPGVFLHELSHYLMAKVLRVPTGRFTIIPRVVGDGTLVMGSVEVAQVDFIRNTLIGAAPLLTGGALVAWLGIDKLGFSQIPSMVAAGQLDMLWATSMSLPKQPDFWLWFYLAFAVSSTMMPSPSDRGGFAACAGALIGVILLAILVGLGPWMLANGAPALNDGLLGIAGLFGVSLVVNIIVGLPFGLLARLISKATGYRVS